MMAKKFDFPWLSPRVSSNAVQENDNVLPFLNIVPASSFLNSTLKLKTYIHVGANAVYRLHSKIFASALFSKTFSFGRKGFSFE